MSEHAPDRIWSGIDIPKTIAGTLAAVSAAVVGSYLGVAGTLIGAAVASVVGSVGTELYARFIQRGSKKIKSTFVAEPAAIGTPPVAAAEYTVPSEEPVPSTPRKVRWARIAGVAGALFVLAMGTLTAYELISGRSVADAVGHKTSSSTTIGSAVRGGNGKSDTPKPAPSESGSPSPSPSPSQDDEPKSTEPTSAPPTGEPTETPTQTTEPTDPQPTDGTNPGTTPTDTPTEGNTQQDDNQQGGGGGQEQQEQNGAGPTDGAE